MDAAADLKTDVVTRKHARLHAAPRPVLYSTPPNMSHTRLHAHVSLVMPVGPRVSSPLSFPTPLRAVTRVASSKQGTISSTKRGHAQCVWLPNILLGVTNDRMSLSLRRFDTAHSPKVHLAVLSACPAESCVASNQVVGRVITVLFDQSQATKRLVHKSRSRTVNRESVLR